MELTILLSKVFGIYFIAVGLIMLLRYGYIKSFLKEFDDQPVLRFIIGAVLLVGGIFIIVSHQDWSTLPAGFISLLGWLTAFKAVLYMSLTNKGVKKWVHWFYDRGWYGVWGPLALIGLGLYLANFAYGFF